jgi:hypothetical protein
VLSADGLVKLHEVKKVRCVWLAFALEFLPCVWMIYMRKMITEFLLEDSLHIFLIIVLQFFPIFLECKTDMLHSKH